MLLCVLSSLCMHTFKNYFLPCLEALRVGCVHVYIVYMWDSLCILLEHVRLFCVHSTVSVGVCYEIESIPRQVACEID